jgi:hypothetical protein
LRKITAEFSSFHRQFQAIYIDIFNLIMLENTVDNELDVDAIDRILKLMT